MSNKVDPHQLLYGKIPPQDTDLEAAVLGAIILEPFSFDEVRDVIDTCDIFYKEEHQHVYSALLAIEARGGKADLLTVTEYLNTHNAQSQWNWAYFVTVLTSNIVSSANISEHARIILDKYRYRESIRIASEMIKESYEQDQSPESLIDTATSKLIDLSGLANQDSLIHVSTAAMQSMHDIEDLMNKDASLIGIDTGIKSLNDIIYGWQDTDLILLAARPGKGKTSLALHFLLSTQKSSLHEPKTGIFFSLEMSSGQLMKRKQSNISGIPLDRVMQGKINNDELDTLMRISAEIGGMNIFIDDQAGLTIPQIRARVKKIKKKKGLDFIIVDYLQLIVPTYGRSNKNRDQEIGEITRGLKQIAKEMNIPVIALSQMNRAVETGGDKRPKLSSLRESGNLEQDASVVIFIHHSIDGITGSHTTELIVEKNRNGKTGSVPVYFDGEKQRWGDMEDVSNQFPGMIPDNPAAGIRPNYSGKYLDDSEETPF